MSKETEAQQRIKELSQYLIISRLKSWPPP